MSEPDRKEFYKLIRQVGSVAFVPMVLAGGPLAGFLLGRWMDHHWKTGTGLTFLLIMAGFFAGARESYRIVRRISREK